jgi:hypothetical protein
MNDSYEKLVSCARQIAVYRGYGNLINGLQPAEVLLAKFKHELLDELAEAAGQHLKIYHELADCLYYAACLDEQDPQAILALHDKDLIELEFVALSNLANVDKLYTAFVFSYMLAHRYGDPLAAQRAALAKYTFRAACPNSKDEQHELEMIRLAIASHS